MTTVADLDALLVATAHECREAERDADAERWVVAHEELDRLLDLRWERREQADAVVDEPPC